MEIRAVHRRDPTLPVVIQKLKVILQEDPRNAASRHDIKKLKGVKPGQGQWRIRAGRYRLRYDVFGRQVVLYSFRHRREPY